jgi:hypothetical protein
MFLKPFHSTLSKYIICTLTISVAVFAIIAVVIVVITVVVVAHTISPNRS